MPSPSLPAPVRAIVNAVTEAVAAARARDLEAYRPAVAQLAERDPEQVGLLLGAVVRTLLEDLHPDGLDGDDLREVLERCTRSALGWAPRVDVDVLVLLLTGALGVHQHEEQPHPLPATDVAWHAPLLLVDLLTHTARPLDVYLTAALAEIFRAETVELP